MRTPLAGILALFAIAPPVLARAEPAAPEPAPSKEAATKPAPPPADPPEPLNYEHPRPPVRLSAYLGFGAHIETTAKTDLIPPEGSKPPRQAALAGGAAFQVDVALTSRLELVATAFAMPGWGARGIVLPIGGRVGLRYDFTSPFAGPTKRQAFVTLFGGVALEAGYVLTEHATRAFDLVYEPEPSFFIGPEVTPVGLRLGEEQRVTLELRAAILFAAQVDHSGGNFGPTWFVPSLWAGYAFWP